MIYTELIKRLRECTAEQNGEKTLWHQAADAIEELSKERKTGKWKLEEVRGDLRTVCSCCERETGTLYEFNFCPNCGARMVSDNEE